MASQSALISARVALLAALTLSCVGPSPERLGTPAPRISELAESADARSRASQRLLMEGLDADARGEPERARSRYELALQLDAGNPWVYLALARHYLDKDEPASALAQLERAEVFFEAQDPGSPRAEVHRIGLRGKALALLGRSDEAGPLLDEAARRAPQVWGDGHLDAAELR